MITQSTLLTALRNRKMSLIASNPPLENLATRLHELDCIYQMIEMWEEKPLYCNKNVWTYGPPEECPVHKVFHHP